MNAPSAKEVQAYNNNFSAALNTKVIQEALRDKVVAAALVNGRQLAVVPASTQETIKSGDYHTLAATGVDTVLEVAITKITLEGSGNDPPAFDYGSACPAHPHER